MRGYVIKDNLDDYDPKKSGAPLVIHPNPGRQEDHYAKVVVFEAGEIEEVKAGILKAIETINIFHGDTAWDLYQGSPEMKAINRALAILEGNDGN